MAAPSYLIITSRAVGGMEKRLLEIWQELAGRGCDVRLVIPGPTYRQLRKRPDLAPLARLEARIQLIDPAGTSFWHMLRALWPIVRTIPAGATVHYLLNIFPFVHSWLGHRIILSWVATRLPRLGLRKSAFADWLMASLSFRQADVIDVLNPMIEEKLARRSGLRRKLNVTAGGTFVDLAHFRPGPCKMDRIVFLGRMEREKGALRFVEAIPEMVRQLAVHGLSAEFVLLGGGGDEEDAIRALLKTEDYRALPIMLGYADDPSVALGPAKIFLSLQRSSNYPSKALAEAMACGCIPIVTDTGESRLMTGEAPAEYVPGAFTPAQLAEAVVRILALPAEAFARRSEAVRRLAQDRFAIGVQADYFARLYGCAAR
ncbi:glycosyltransferase family 4 protein [Sphingosinicella rhizophila]|uniref:Glycosyltransferase family 4 protein n=1 Tax=Sphingosinicella rhizophila TaxID=3050082 RepID=A0ABU3Q9G5_9SPHN|nr:glycosyltransferase family 4 protein [Sphingosinicella sp. GR2756]MDT9599638.1 glycosyltransferase family 4 protein [Sphingosinicella sp. GR2756]